jgi:hypothetical protein
MLQVFQRHAASVCSKYFICFRYMLQAFVQNVLFVSDICCERFYLDIAYVSHLCYKSLFEMFHIFQSYVAICKYFIWMLHMFHTHIVIVCYKCFICFSRMLHPSVLYFRGREFWGIWPRRQGMGRGEPWAGGRGTQRTSDHAIWGVLVLMSALGCRPPRDRGGVRGRNGGRGVFRGCTGVRICGREERGGGKAEGAAGAAFLQARVTMVAWASKHALLSERPGTGISRALIKINFGISFFFDAKEQTKTDTTQQ